MQVRSIFVPVLRVHSFVTARVLLAAGSLAASAASPAHADVFQRLVGTQVFESVESIRNAPQGGFLTAGDIAPTPGAERFNVIRYDGGGNVFWSTMYGGPEPAHAYSVTPASNDQSVTAGRRMITFNPLGLALLRLDPVGNLVWAWNYRGDAIPFDAVNLNNTPSVSVVNARNAAGDNGFAVATGIGPNGPMPNSTLGQLLVVNDGGGQIFNNAYFQGAVANPGRLTFTDVRFDAPSLTFVVTGTLMSNVQVVPGGPIISRREILFARINSAGNVVLARTYRLPPSPTGEVAAWGAGIELTGSGDVVISGQTDAFGPNTTGAVVMRLTPGGAVLWAGLFKDFIPHFRAVHEAPDRTLGVAGTTRAVGPLGGPMTLLTLDPAGNLIFEREYGPVTPPDLGKACIPLPSPACGWAVVGDKTLATGLGSRDIIFARTDQFGRTGCFENRIAAERLPTQPIEAAIELLPIGMQEQTFWQAPLVHPQTIAPPLCFGPVACPGDANGDGTVNFADVTVVLANFGMIYPAGCLGPGDANGDGIVNFADVTVVLANFGAVCP